MLRPSNNNLQRQALKTSKREARLTSGLGLRLQSFTVAQLVGDMAAANRPGALVYCSNGSAGAACIAYSNGTAWKVVAAIGATVSAT